MGGYIFKFQSKKKNSAYTDSSRDQKANESQYSYCSVTWSVYHSQWKPGRNETPLLVPLVSIELEWAEQFKSFHPKMLKLPRKSAQNRLRG